MHTIIYSALATPLILIGSLILGGALGSILNERLPGHQTDPVNILLSAIPALGAVIAGGALWGWGIARITGAGDARRMARAGAIGFGPTMILVAFALTFFENLIVEQGQGPQWPIHNVFTLLFTPAAAIIAGVGAFAIATSARSANSARLGGLCALAAGLAFLIVNLGLDAWGFRVGAPGAAERATMLTTAFLGNFLAAMAAGGLIGARLARNQAMTLGR